MNLLLLWSKYRSTSSSSLVTCVNSYLDTFEQRLWRNHSLIRIQPDHITAHIIMVQMTGNYWIIFSIVFFEFCILSDRWMKINKIKNQFLIDDAHVQVATPESLRRTMKRCWRRWTSGSCWGRRPWPAPQSWPSPRLGVSGPWPPRQPWRASSWSSSWARSLRRRPLTGGSARPRWPWRGTTSWSPRREPSSLETRMWLLWVWFVMYE